MILDAEITNSLLQVVDAVREILAAIESTGKEGAGDYSAIVTRLEVLAARPSQSIAALPSEPAAEITPVMSEQKSDPAQREPLENEAASTEIDILPPNQMTPDPVAAPRPLMSDASPHGVAPDTADDGSAEQDRFAAATADSLSGDVLANVAESDSRTHDEREEQPTESGQTEGRVDNIPPPESPAPSALGSVRVDVALLNELMNQVGELVLARNQIRPFADAVQARVFSNAIQQLDLITTDLQEGIMKTRMQPIGKLWSRLPRIVRDLARGQNKQVQLEMHGRETELDRTLIEAIKDPLTHLVRNAVDHGIETPAQRLRKGKPETGNVVLRAFHEGGLVNIEISDDGAGIDPERVREKALRQGLISREQARGMSDHQVTQLIFLPGLSTAERVTDISGRGVGMDVVKTNIERIGGSVTITSQVGRGTSLRVKIPLTLAIIPALMVSARGQRFAIPQVSLREIVTLYDGKSSPGIEHIGEHLVYRLRGELLPLIRLSELLRLPEPPASREHDFAFVVVLQAIGQRFGLIVDEVKRTEEIVVKPLHKTLARIPVFSGATVMGDGCVALILDVVGLARTAGVTQQEEVPVSQEEDLDESWDDEPSVHGDYLVCEAAPNRFVAIPLLDVTRLEEFSASVIESASGQVLVPYGDHILPLLQLDGFSKPLDQSETRVSVVVHGMGDRHVGLMVQRILDVSEAAQPLDTSQRRPGLLGRSLIGGHVLDVMDIKGLVRSAGIVFPDSVQKVS